MARTSRRSRGAQQTRATSRSRDAGSPRREDEGGLPSAGDPSAIGSNDPRRHAALALAIFAVTCAFFFPAYGYDFSRFDGYVWDDADHYLDDPLIASPDGWWRIWFDPQPGIVGAEGGAAVWNYWPLTRGSFWLDRHLFGSDERGRPNLFASHLINVALHGLNAVLVFLVLAALRVPGAVLAGFLYAVHPVTVESVAWLTERKNLLSTLFFLLALLAWVRFQEEGRLRFYAATTGAFLLALMAKTATVMFPVVLVLMHAWRREPLDARRVLRVAPFFAMSLVAGLTSIVFERSFISPGDAWATSVGERIAAAGQIVWFYLGKLVWPANLAFNYPRFQIDADSALSYLPTLAALGVATALVLLRNRGPELRGAAFVGACFVVGLFPVLGFFNLYGMRYAHVADHWQYLPCIAVLAGLAAAGRTGVDRLKARFVGRGPVFEGGAFALAGGVVVALGALTYAQSSAYVDATTLWRHTLVAQPASAIAHNNLGAHLRGQQRYDEARAAFQAAIESDPSFVEPYVNLGNLINFTTGQLAPAVPWWRKAVERDSAQPIALYNLALYAFEQRDPAQSEALLVRSLEAEPGFGMAFEMLSRLYNHQGRAEELQRYVDRARYKALALRNAGRGIAATIWLAMGTALAGALAIIVYETRKGGHF